MIPPRGFRAELYPLRHNVRYAFGLSAVTTTQNTAFATLVRHSTDVDKLPKVIEVNPHNTAYVEETGAHVQKMSILDKLTLSIKFNLTENAMKGELATDVFGDSMGALKLLWRPIFFSFPEKLTASDEDTGITVATLLALTSDDTNEDVVPITTAKLPTTGTSDLLQPMSSVNSVEVFGDYNMTTNTGMEDHTFDEDLLQDALRRFTNRGALKACMGRTRHLTLTESRPYKNYYLDKFVPRSIRRVVDRTFLGIQVHIPTVDEVEQTYVPNVVTPSVAHVGCKIICNYHEWNADHYQEMAPI